MKYEVLLVNDSSAGEMTEKCYEQPYNINNYREYIKEHNSFPLEKPPIWIKIYDDKEFNSLNDFVYSLQDFIINDKVKSILENHKLPNHDFVPAEIHRNERKILFNKLSKYKHYYWFNTISDYNDYVDFSKSEIKFTKDKKIIQLNINSILELYSLRNSNQKISNRINMLYKLYPNNQSKIQEIILHEDLFGVSWRAEKIVLNKNFDRSLDLFSLPIFSSRTYISQKLKENLIKENITDISFIKTGNNPDPKYLLNPELEISDLE
ncbi:hypothetical protein [Epilithonimonas lactis]|nr:hypothetical protein [Epilithonimonas lactis]SEQ11395.1 hypothetical protein SAMN04488097_1369 [Epilithonimonas lactis]